jgi:hypothetical protein
MDTDAHDIAREQARWRDMAELGYIRPEHCDHRFPSADPMARCVICGKVQDCPHQSEPRPLGDIRYCPDCYDII